MKRSFFNAPHFKWILVMLLLMALLVAIIIYYNRRIKNIDDQLKRISWVSPDSYREVRGEYFRPMN